MGECSCASGFAATSNPPAIPGIAQNSHSIGSTVIDFIARLQFLHYFNGHPIGASKLTSISYAVARRCSPRTISLKAEGCIRRPCSGRIRFENKPTQNEGESPCKQL